MSDPQARAASVLAALGVRSKDYGYWSDEDWRAHVAAALAEAGLLADLETRRFGAIFDDLDAARAELAQVKKQGLSLIAELQQVKAERDNCREKWRRAWRRAERVEAALGRVQALADEWRTAHGDPPVDPSHISVRHAERLLALIGDQP